jgi:hypothetical protein
VKPTTPSHVFGDYAGRRVGPGEIDGCRRWDAIEVGETDTADYPCLCRARACRKTLVRAAAGHNRDSARASALAG